MYAEGALGGGLLALILAGYKILSKKIDNKVDLSWCNKMEHRTCTRIAKGEEKFEKIVEIMQDQAVSLGKLFVEIKNIDKELANISKILNN